MQYPQEVLVIVVFIVFLAWDFFTGVNRRSTRSAGEWLVDGLSTMQLPPIKAAVMALAFALGAALLPAYHNSLQALPFWLGFLLVFLPDDLSHYWLHRLAHEHPWLWGFHRTHHTPGVYQTSIAFRENWLWFWIMPGFWWMGLMVYLGLLEQVLLSTAIIGIHNVWLHTGSTADRRLYDHPFTRKLMHYLEHLINTPALHRAHHGLGGSAVPMGNYAQTLFIWDVLFGSATFTQGALPEAYGTLNERSMKQAWYYHLWWPLFKEKPVVGSD